MPLEHMKQCKICGESFIKHSLYANHIRWKHRDNLDYKKKVSLNSIKTNEGMYGKWIYDKVNCFICNNDIDIRYREGKKKEKYYCSRSCANKRNHSKETKDKISKSVSDLWKNEDYRSKYIYNNGMFSSKGEIDLKTELEKIYGENGIKSHVLIEHDNISKSVDIFISSKNTIIEYDGKWHFEKVIKEHNFDKTLEKDKMVNDYCSKNNIKLIRISDNLYKNKKNIYLPKIIESIESNNCFYIEFYK